MKRREQLDLKKSSSPGFLLQQYTPPHCRPGLLDLLVRLGRRSGLVSAPRRGLSGRQMTEMFHFEDFVDDMEPVEHCSREKDKTLL